MSTLLKETMSTFLARRDERELLANALQTIKTGETVVVIDPCDTLGKQIEIHQITGATPKVIEIDRLRFNRSGRRIDLTSSKKFIEPYDAETHGPLIEAQELAKARRNMITRIGLYPLLALSDEQLMRISAILDEATAERNSKA